MIDLIPGIQFTDTEKQVYGSIGGALLGAIIGSAATFIISSHERRKQDDLHRVRLNQSHIHECAKALQRAEMTLTDILLKCEANNQYVEDIKKGLVKHNDQGVVALMQASTPFEYPRPETDIAQYVLNDKIVTLWVNLCQEVELQNKNLSDFAQFYKGVFETVHNSLLKNEEIDASVVASDNDTIMKSMTRQLEVNALLRKKCLDVLAYIDCYNKYLGQTNIRKFKQLKEYRAFIEKISAYEPSRDAFQAARQQEEETYDPAKMFKTNSTGEA